MKMQNPPTFFGTIEDDFFEPGSACSNPFALCFIRYARQVINIFELEGGRVNVTDAVGKLFDGVRMNPTVYLVECLIQIGVVI